MILPDEWTLTEFNKLLEDVDPDEVLARGNCSQDDVMALCAFGLHSLVEERGIENPKDLISHCISMGVGMFAAGMELQKLLDLNEKENNDGVPE